ncbi:putative membrane protein [Halapricum desulfuricans]|uniref:Putative membrane protein n=2 Tax=Halapricum desulfuricans TaxID=2841257 RepID=A0A897N4P7_9EURY|nr:putative membrane protein [Halapricum desulfuricans]
MSDRLELFGTLAGALLVLIGLGTIAGMPWQTNGSLAASVLQLLGVLATIAVGAGLVWLVRQ